MAVGLTFLVQLPLAEVLKAFRATVDLKADPLSQFASVLHLVAYSHLINPNPN